MKYTSYTFLLFSVCFLFSCGCGGNFDQTLITSLIDQFYTDLGQNKYDNISKYFSEDVKMVNNYGVANSASDLSQFFQYSNTSKFTYEILNIEPTCKFVTVEVTENINGQKAVAEFRIEEDVDKKFKISKYISVLPSSMLNESRPLSDAMVHAVYFWLNDNQSDADKAAFSQYLDELVRKSKYINQYQVGISSNTAKREVVDHSFDYALILTFSNEEDHNNYHVEQAHLNFVENIEGKVKKVVVYDSTIY